MSSGGTPGAAGAPAEVVLEDSGLSPSPDPWPRPCVGEDCGGVEDVVLGDEVGCLVNREGLATCFEGLLGSVEGVLSAPVPELDAASPLVKSGRGAYGVVASGVVEVSFDLFTSPRARSLVEHPELAELDGLVAGTAHACGLLPDGRVGCAGSNAWLQLGVEGEPEGLVEVPGVEGVVALAASTVTTCALHAAGTVTCWGGASFVLPEGSVDFSAAPPSPIPDLPALSSIAMGGDRACGLTAAGAAWCWGATVACSSQSQCERREQVPRPVPWLDGASELGLEDDALCGVVAGVIRCEIDGGQTCDADTGWCTANPTRFVDRIGGLDEVDRLRTGGSVLVGDPGQRCAIRRDGTLWCWDANLGPARQIVVD